MKNNLILIGFMGVGKGSISREIVRQSGVFAIDTDDLIVSLTNKEVKEIFKKRGEEHFRALEQQCADWIESSVAHTLISAGGGFYKVSNLKSLGKVVLLDASFEWIYERITKSANAKAKIEKRPLFKDKKAAKKLYDSRLDVYREVADFVVDVEGKSSEEIATLVFNFGKKSKIFK